MSMTYAQRHVPANACPRTPRLVPHTPAGAGWQDCKGGKCERKPECHFYASANDMGDGGGTHAQWHTDNNARAHCNQLGGAWQGQCNNVDGSKYVRECGLNIYI